MASSENRCEEVEVAIVGAGIAGVATALALRRVGAEGVVVLERAPALRTTGAALGLFPNAWRALAALGVGPKLTRLYPIIRSGRVTNLTTGVTQEVSLGSSPDSEASGVRVVHRRILLDWLAEELPPGTIRFSAKISSVSTQSPKDASSGIILRLEDGSVIKAKVLVGCDGVHSVVADWLGLSAAVDSGRAAVRGLAVYPDGHGLKPSFNQALGKGVRAGSVPMNDKEVYWFITNKASSNEREISPEPELVLKHAAETMLAKDFPPCFLQHARHSDAATVSWAPLLLRSPWNILFGQTHKGNVVVTGDAMHPMTPDLGQGGCAALEDAVVLGRNFAACLLLDGSVDGEKAAGCLANFANERRWRAAKLVAASNVSGWMQQGGAGWWEPAVKFVRDSAFYRFIFPKLVSSIIDYDCGSLPAAIRA